jgi:hypothetical protein
LIFIRQSRRDEYQSSAEFLGKLLNLMTAMHGEKVLDKDDRLVIPIGKPWRPPTLSNDSADE